MRNALTDLSEGREPTPPPENTDEVNDAELPNGIGTPLADVDGVFNAVVAHAGDAGPFTFEGRGAGEEPTTSCR